MSSPKIGKAFEKASNALAFHARKLREEGQAALRQDAILDRLRKLGEEFANEQRASKQREADQQVASLQPVMQKAREFIAETEAARKEAQPVLASFFAMPWESVIASLDAGHGLAQPRQEIETIDENGETVLRAAPERYSTHTTKTRVSAAIRLAKELQEIVAATNDDIKVALREAEMLTEVSSSRSQYRANALRLCVSRGSTAETIRRKLDGLKKLLDEIGEIVIPNEEAK